MKEFTLALIFDLSGSRTLLIHKTSLNSPPAVYDKWNGVGGKLNIDESPLEGCVREIKEETNLSLSTLKHFANLTDGENWKVYCFYTFTNKISNYTQTTSEKLEIYNTKLLPENCVSNIPYLVNMALNFERESADLLEVKEIYFD